MSIVKFHDAAGRECKVYWLPGTLDEVEQNYHACGCECQLCSEETIMNERIGSADVVRFSTGREATGQELIKHSAGNTLAALARQHMARKGGTFSEALIAVSKICPGETKAYLNLKPL